MNIINRLTLRHLWNNRNRTLITILGIMLSVAMVCAVAGFTLSMKDVLYRTTIETRGDYHIAYYGLTEETAKKLAAEEIFASSFTREGEEPGTLTLLVRMKNPGRDYFEVATQAGAKYGVEHLSANLEQLALEGVVAQSSIMLTFYAIAAIAIAIIVAGSIIVIANAFYISASERVRQFGLLKSVGATKAQIGRSILYEAFLLAVISIPLGIGMGFLIQAVVLAVTNGLLTELNTVNQQELVFRVVFHPSILYISAGISSLTMLVSAWLPARRAAKTSPIDAIRQTKDIKIRAKKLRTSWLTQKLFGFEGTLAAKSLKRSKTKYRATVISLTVSIVMVISVSSLVWVLNKSVDMEYGGSDFDVLVFTTGNIEKVQDIHRKLASIPGAEIQSHLDFFAGNAALPEGFLTKSAEEDYRALHKTDPPTEAVVNFIAYPDDAFAKIAPIQPETLTGILVNTSGKRSVNGKHIEYIPYHFQSNTSLSIRYTADDGSVEETGITLAAATNEIPANMPYFQYQGGSMNILIPQSVFNTLAAAAPSRNINALFTAVTGNSSAFCTQAFDLLPNTGHLSIQDVAQMTRMNRNLVLIIMLFGYGFIGMLSLIAVTSVIATISTGMALRKQEFAMLSSAGMTPGGMRKMLNLESLLYGIKSLAIGLPMGVALSYLIFMAMSATISFPYRLPVNAMLISGAAVMLLTFFTMHYSKRKLGKCSIVEAIRGENI